MLASELTADELLKSYKGGVLTFPELLMAVSKKKFADDTPGSPSGDVVPIAPDSWEVFAAAAVQGVLTPSEYESLLQSRP